MPLQEDGARYTLGPQNSITYYRLQEKQIARYLQPKNHTKIYNWQNIDPRRKTNV
jgi:hypothetical protein